LEERVSWEVLEGLEVLERLEVLEVLGGKAGLGETGELAGEMLEVEMSYCLRARFPHQSRRLPYVDRVLL
jgi:hypothetical protein